MRRPKDIIVEVFMEHLNTWEKAELVSVRDFDDKVDENGNPIDEFCRKFNMAQKRHPNLLVRLLDRDKYEFPEEQSEGIWVTGNETRSYKGMLGN